MAFLNNSGDIILDAVLTDTGRMHLANGTFNVEKFALADDEIDYSLWDIAGTTSTQDISILKTLVFEAFTNNAATMKNKLITIQGLKDILFLPVMRINNLSTGGQPYSTKVLPSGYIVAVDIATETALSGLKGSTANSVGTFLFGATTNSTSVLRVDLGIDTSAIDVIDENLKESAFTFEMDNRLGYLLDANKLSIESKNKQYVDDDNMASYLVTVAEQNLVDSNVIPVGSTAASEVISGPRDKYLKFSVGSSTLLKTSTYLFDQIGTTVSLTGLTGGTVKVIYSSINIQGVDTGALVSVPVAYVKYIAS